MKGRILLLGAGGQLGKEWELYLKKNGLSYKPCTSNMVDITDQAALRSVFNSYHPNIVINCAAYTHVDLAEDEDEEAREVNGEAVGSIAKLCEDAGAKLVHYSTDYVFKGEQGDQEVFPLGYPETHKPQPINTYGWSKLMGEQLIQKKCSDYLIIRVSWLLGAHGNNFVKTMLRLSKEKDKLQVVNDQLGAPTFTDNLVFNTVALINTGYKGIIHVSSEGLTNWHEIAVKIFQNKGINSKLVPIPTSDYPTIADRPLYSRLDISRLKDIPGVRIIRWQDGLQELLDQIK
ncbi:MAG: dTDP-4-dehydrorhamnose reductase [Balneolales bacterium]